MSAHRSSFHGTGAAARQAYRNADPAPSLESVTALGAPVARFSFRSGRIARVRGVTAEALEDVRAELGASSSHRLGQRARRRHPGPIGALRTRPETRELLECAMREVLAVARAHGVALPDDVVEETLAFTDTVPAEGTASMQRDIIAGRPSELEAQSGAVVRLGREKGVATPVHEFVYRTLVPLERRARGEVAF